MKYADPKRMPVDENKVVDLLKNQHIFRKKLNDEIPNYTEQKQNHQFENGVLTYLSNVAKGDMLDLVREVGINRDSMDFTSIQDLLDLESKFVHPSDRMFGKFLNAQFTPLDMTDYEDDFASFAEYPGEAPLQDVQRLLSYAEEPWPQSDMTAGLAIPDDPPINAVTPSMKEVFQDFYAVPEEEEIDFYGADDGGDDDEYGDEYGEEGGEGGEEEYGEEDYGEEEEVVWPPPALIQQDPLEDRYFKAGETMRGQYSDVEIQAFMNLLSIKPRGNWQDQSIYHARTGVHEYEDSNQELDPDFHILSEEEREVANRKEVEKWRSGSEVKFVLDGRRPITPNYRF